MPKIVDKDAMRARIHAAALSVFRRDGLAGAKMADIAKEAALAKGTLYIYFPSKDALIAGIIAAEFDTAEAALAALPAEMPLPDLIEALATMMRASIEGAAGLRLFLEAMGSGLATGEMRAALGRAFDAMAAEIAVRLVPHGYQSEEAQSLARTVLAMADGVILHQGLFAQDADLTTQFRALLAASLVERHARP